MGLSPIFVKKLGKKYSDSRSCFFPITFFFDAFWMGSGGGGGRLQRWTEPWAGGKGDNCIIAYGIWLTDPDGQGGDDAVACLLLGSD